MAIKITLRSMKTADIPAVAAMEAVCFPDDAWSPSAFEAALSEPYGLFFTAWAEDVLAGYGIAYRMMDEAEILNLAVLPEYRRQGIGAALLSRLLTPASDAAPCRTFLEVRRSNAAAIALYEGFGFQTVGVRRNYYVSPREDALLMVREPDGETNGRQTVQ